MQAVIFALLVCGAVALLHPDQVGERDWGKENLGAPKHVVYQGRHVVVATESGVLARVQARTGSVHWRRVFPSGESIDALCAHKKTLFTFSKNTGKASMWQSIDGTLVWDQIIAQPAAEGVGADAFSHEDLDHDKDGIQDVLVLSNNVVTLLSGADGQVLWTTPTEESQQSGPFTKVMAGVDDGAVYTVASTPKGEMIVRSFDLQNGAFRNEKSYQAVTGFSHFNGEQIAYVDKLGALKSLDVSSGKSTVVKEKSYSSAQFASVATDATSSAPPVVAVQHKKGYDVYSWAAGGLSLIATYPVGKARAFGFFQSKKSDKQYVAVSTLSGEKTTVEVIDMAGGSQPSLSFEMEGFSERSEGGVYRIFPTLLESAKSGATKCRAIIVTLGHSVAGVQDGKAMFVRDESLASLTSVVMVEKDDPAPPSVHAAVGGAEMPSFGARLKLQVEEIVAFASKATNLFSTLIDYAKFLSGGAGGTSGKAKQMSDTDSIFFGFFKVIVATSANGKLVALDSNSGDLLWSVYFGEVQNDLSIAVVRGQKRVGKLPEVLLTVKDRESGHASFYWIDASSGAINSKRQVDRRVSHTLMLSGIKEERFSDELLVVIDENDTIETFPENSAGARIFNKKYADVYFSMAKDSLVGYGVAKSAEGDLKKYQLWSIQFPGTTKSVAAVASSSLGQGVNSPVHVLGDDSLMIKHLNPHLLAIALLGEQQKADKKESTVTIMLADAVTGRVVQRFVHRNAAEPVHITQSENWVFYTFWNTKARRNEIGSIALYDGAVDAYSLNPWTRLPKIIQNEKQEVETSYSSYGAEQPVILQKTFVFPSGITTLSGINTRDGITEKQLLVGTIKGQILQLNRRFLDPRRPVAKPTKADQAEQLMPYHPIVPIIPINILSYNKQIERLSKIVSVPAGLESTTLVLGVGLDIFFTRAMPSQGFDILPEDFQWELVLIIMTALYVGQFMARKSNEKKELGKRWK